MAIRSNYECEVLQGYLYTLHLANMAAEWCYFTHVLGINNSRNGSVKYTNPHLQFLLASTCTSRMEHLMECDKILPVPSDLRPLNVTKRHAVSLERIFKCAMLLSVWTWLCTARALCLWWVLYLSHSGSVFWSLCCTGCDPETLPKHLAAAGVSTGWFI